MKKLRLAVKHVRLRRPRRSRVRTRWAAVGALAATALLSGRLAGDAQADPLDALLERRAVATRQTGLQPPRLPEFRAGGVETRSLSAWLCALTPGAMARPAVTLSPATPRAEDTQTGPVQRFDIAPGTLATVVAAFAKTTGLEVIIADPALGALNSPGVTGLHTVNAALQQILSGTGLGFRFGKPTEVTIEVERLSESLEVTASQPRPASPRYAKPLAETPQTIQVIPRQVMEAQGATTLTDALRNVPGISLQAGEGGGASNTTGDMFNMRGFSANNSLFVDGVRDDGLISRDVFNLEQVEVFLGPTGSDVGRGTAAGYVNMTTKTPRALSLYSGSVGFGTSEQKRGTLDINQAIPLGESGTWLSGTAFRLNGLLQDSGVPGRDYAESETQAIAPSVALGLGTHTRITAGGQFTRQDNVPDYGVPSPAWPDGPLTATGWVASQPVDQSTYYGSPDVDYDEVAQDNYFARLEHDIAGTIQLRNQTRHNMTHRAALITAPGASQEATETVSLLRQANERENRITSNQTSLAANLETGRIRHAVTGTLEVMKESQFAPSFTGTGTRGPVSIYNPDPFEPVIGLALTRTGAFTEGETSTVAVSFFDAVDLTSKLQITGGLRLERYDTSYLAMGAEGVATTDERAEDTLFSGKIGLLYKLTDLGNVYLSYGSTKTPPGTANFTLSAQGNNQNNPNVEPQESTNLELGSKWDFFASRLSLTGAVFNTRNKNVIYTVDPNAVPPVFNQDDEQQVKGVSVGIAGRIVRAWDVTANFAYLDSENKSQNPANAGRRLSLTPEFSGSVWTTYTLPIGLTVGGGIRLMDSVYVNAANTIKVPSFTLVDAVATYALTRQVSLRLNLYNLTDEVYIRNINNNGGRYNPGQPRTAVVTTSFSF